MRRAKGQSTSSLSDPTARTSPEHRIQTAQGPSLRGWSACGFVLRTTFKLTAQAIFEVEGVEGETERVSVRH